MSAAVATETPALAIEDLEVVYHRRGREDVRAVAGVSLSVQRGQILGLVGESGCGKSTLARAVVGLEKPAAGRILFEGRELSPLTRRARPLEDTRLQMVFQNPFSSLNPRRKIGVQLREALAMAAGADGSRVTDERVHALLEQVGMPASAAERYAHQFSGGQRQRIAIARALSSQPEFIVCDEPTSALDVSVQAQVLDLMTELQEEFGLTYLLISHNLAVIRQMANDVGVLHHGVLVESGPVDAIFDNPQADYTKMLLNAVPDLADIA